MTANKVEFPAKLVGYRIDLARERIVLFEDTPVLCSDAELQRRIAAYRALEAAGAIPYTFELFSLEDLEASKAEIRAGLERQLAQVKDWQQRRSPAPTNGHPRRIDLIMAYEADGARALPRINGNGQLVRFEADGSEATPPAQTVPELYRWLQAEGYVPDGFQWLGWERGLRQRRQTYILNGCSSDPHTHKEVAPCSAS